MLAGGDAMKRWDGARTGIGIAVAALLLAGLSAITFVNVRRLITADRWMDHTRQVLDRIQGVLSSLADASASVRGYALTGERTSLVPYAAAAAGAGTSLDAIARLTADDPAQRERSATLRRAVTENLTSMRQLVAARDQGGLDAAVARVREGTIQTTLDAVRRAAGSLAAAERDVLARRTGNFERTATMTIVSLALGAVLLFTFLGMIWTLVRLDLKRRSEAAESLRMSEEELRITLRSIGDGVIATDSAGRVSLMNPIAERLTGWSEAEARGRPAREVLHLVDESTGREVESPTAVALREGRAVGLANHTLLVSRSGERIPIADSGAPIRDADGRTRGAVIVFRDITAKRRADLEIQRLAAIVSSSEDAIVGESLDGKITAWNAAAERLFGYTADEVMNRPVALLERPGFEDETAARLVRIRQGERVQQFDTARVGKGGHPLAVSVSLSPIRDGEGNVVGASKIVRDITERKEAEAALKASEERFRVLSDAVASLVWESDGKGVLDYVNRAWRDYTGTSPDESRRAAWTDVVHPDDRQVVLAKWHRCVIDGEPFEVELRLRRRDGTYRWFLARAARIASRTGSLLVGSAADIDDLKNTAAALRDAKDAAEEAARSKDRFLAVLSHELRTPLTPALVVAQVLERRRDLAADIRESASLIRRNVELETLLVDDLLDLTKISRGMIELRRQTVDVHELARQVLEICRSDLIGRRQTMDLDLQAAEHHTDADPARLQQVLWNLVKNAIKFTPIGGAIRVRTENPAPHKIRISVEDNGIGIPAGILPRVFEPFERGSRTVSPRLSGLGLGLSISKRLIELHGGTITAASEGEGKGATFGVELPAFVGGAIASPPKRTRQRSSRRLSILLVEDHHDTAGALAQLLTEEGHAVTVADSVAAAVEAFRQNPADLLITDLGLPDGSGHELLGILRTVRPVEAIVISGYGMDADVAKSRAMGFAQHLTKPVQISRLLRALDELGQDAEAVGREA